MSKKHKSNRKPQPPAKKAAVQPPVVKVKNRRPVASPVRQSVAPAPPARGATGEPRAAERGHAAPLPFWARMPLAVIDFWMSPVMRGGRKS
jgi:hypothetical protein